MFYASIDIYDASQLARSGCNVLADVALSELPCS